MKQGEASKDPRDQGDRKETRRQPLGRCGPLSPSNTPAAERFIPPHGGYENLLSFQKARIVYDGTVWFCAPFLEKRDRTVDQMTQAARSGKQNILEGSQASG